MTDFDRRLLTPPQHDEEIYPYSRPWRSIAIEVGIVLILTIGLFFLVNLVGLPMPESIYQPSAVILAIVPFGLWLYFTWWQERIVPDPRQRLLVVVIISAILANAIGIPIINSYLQVDRWLPLSNAISRILGYTFTVGVVQEFLKYLSVRYIAWPHRFRTRLDGVAYGAASGIGYATVLNLHFALTNSPPPDIAALRFFATFAVHIATGVTVGYGLSESRFGQPTPFLLTITLALATLITGIAIPIHAGLTNASLDLGVSAPKPLLGLTFSVALLIGSLLILSFLYTSAERQAREAASEREH